MERSHHEDRSHRNEVKLPRLREVGDVDVLIIDDVEPVRSVMRRVLDEAGYTVTAVENGLAAMTAVQETRYRAIVCDISMPLVDGLRFYEFLVSGFPALAKRVLFVTAMADEPKIADFLTRTGCPVLEKPYDLKALVQVVADLVGRAPSPGTLF